MIRIGLLSDTHSYWDDRYEKYFTSCDEIWHCGDFGSMEIADRLSSLKPLRGVYGNIDGGDLRRRFSQYYRFRCEEVDVLMTHIGGYPGRYSPMVRARLFVRPPQLFVCGHSHILKVEYDQTLNCLHINPGAAGLYGIQSVRTLVRFSIEGKEIKDLEVIELASSRF